MNIKSEVSVLIKKLTDKNMTKKLIAEKCHVSQSQVTEWSKGAQIPNPKSLSILRALGNYQLANNIVIESIIHGKSIKFDDNWQFSFIQQLITNELHEKSGVLDLTSMEDINTLLKYNSTEYIKNRTENMRTKIADIGSKAIVCNRLSVSENDIYLASEDMINQCIRIVKDIEVAIEKAEEELILSNNDCDETLRKIREAINSPVIDRKIYSANLCFDSHEGKGTSLKKEIIEDVISEIERYISHHFEDQEYASYYPHCHYLSELVQLIPIVLCEMKHPLRSTYKDLDDIQNKMAILDYSYRIDDWLKNSRLIYGITNTEAKNIIEGAKDFVREFRAIIDLQKDCYAKLKHTVTTEQALTESLSVVDIFNKNGYQRLISGELIKPEQKPSSNILISHLLNKTVGSVRIAISGNELIDIDIKEKFNEWLAEQITNRENIVEKMIQISGQCIYQQPDDKFKIYSTMSGDLLLIEQHELNNKKYYQLINNLYALEVIDYISKSEKYSSNIQEEVKLALLQSGYTFEDIVCYQ